MTESNGRWSADQDPPRDELLGGLLRRAEAAGAGAGVDWERLRETIMRRAEGREDGGRWVDVVIRWRRVALAASIGAILGAAALLWRAESAASTLAADERSAPESVALARVVAAYPDEAVLTSLLQSVRDDEFTAWSDR